MEGYSNPVPGEMGNEIDLFSKIPCNKTLSQQHQEISESGL